MAEMVVAYNPFKNSYAEVTVANAQQLLNCVDEIDVKYGTELPTRVVAYNPFKNSYAEVAKASVEKLKECVTELRSKYPGQFS